MPRRTIMNVRTGERRTVETGDIGRDWKSEAEGGPLFPFAPRDKAPPIDMDELPKGVIIEAGQKGEHEDFDDLDGIDLEKSWADPRVNPTPWKRNIIGTAQHATPPTDGNGSGGGGTDPDLTTEPFIFKGGPPTSSIIIMLKQPSTGGATAGAGGFTLTVWIRDPGTHFWGVTTAFSLNYNDIVGTHDFNGGELFFQITNVAATGNVVALVKEQY